MRPPSLTHPSEAANGLGGVPADGLGPNANGLAAATEPHFAAGATIARPPALGARHFVRSALALGTGHALTFAGSAVLAVMLPRYLGDVYLGKYAFALALTTLVGLVGNLGTASYVAKEIARDRTSAARLVAASMAVRLPINLAVALVTVLVVGWSGYDSVTVRTIDVLCIAVGLGVFDLLTGVLQGLHRMQAMAAVTTVQKLVYAGLAALLLLQGGGPIDIAAAWVAGMGVGVAVAGVAVLRDVRPDFRIGLPVVRTVFFGGLPFLVWQASLTIYGQIDTVLLSVMTHDAVVGWYSAAYRIVSIPGFVPVIAVTVLFPAMSAAAGDDQRFGLLARRAIHVVLLLSLPMALGTMLLPFQLMDALGYPASFLNSAVPIVLLALHIPLVGVDMVIGCALQARDRQRQWAVTGVAAAILNPLTNLFAISYAQRAFGNGAIGAAAVTTLTEVFMMVVGLRLLGAGVLGWPTLENCLRILGAGLAMAGAVWLVRDLPIVVPMTTGVAVYAVASLLLGTLSIRELREVARHVLDRGASARPSAS